MPGKGIRTYDGSNRGSDRTGHVAEPIDELRSVNPQIKAERRRAERSSMSTTHRDPLPLDGGIAVAVETLQAAGVHTFESCEGGGGHAFAEPTVRFHGDRTEGYRALAAALASGLQARDLRRVWPIVDGELTGPWWELTFAPTTDLP
jgi:hypothetical protein